MFNLLKWIYDLGYKHARYNYRHRLLERARRRDEIEIQLISFDLEALPTERERKRLDYLHRQKDIEDKLAKIINEVFDDTRQNNQP